MRLSQAFAAFRSSLVADYQNDILQDLVPVWNSECEDVRREHEKRAKDPKVGEALADHYKRARIADMRIRQQQFIDSLNSDLKINLGARVLDYKGTIEEIEVVIPDGTSEKKKTVLEAKFSDGSSARVPRNLWVDYTLFDRI